MTLGSTPPWRACAVLLPAHIPPKQHPARLARLLRLPRLQGLSPLYAPGNLCCPNYRSFSRAQSTAARAPVPRHDGPPSEHTPPLPRAALGSGEPSLLIDRLRPVPVRRHGAGDSAVVAPLDLYPNKRELHNTLVRKRRELTQQARAEQHWRLTRQPGDWRVVLQSLMESTPAWEEPRNGIKVIIPSHSVALLLSDFQNNLWNIKSRSKCDLTLYQPAEPTPGVVEDAAANKGTGGAADAQPYIIVSGQPDAIGDAADAILKVAGRATIVNIAASAAAAPRGEQTRPSPPAEGSTAPLFTATPISHYPTSTPCAPYKLTKRADEIPWPRTWTMESFHLYVAALVMGRPHGGYAERRYAGRTDNHQDTVVRLLDAVFRDPAASAAITIPALKLALSYLVRSGATFVSRARALVARAIRLGLRLDTEVYNMLAETSVKTRNLLAFQHTVHQMVNRGHKPDLRTWVLFLRIIQAEEVRRYIIHAMHSKNYLVDARAVNSVAPQMADHDIYRAIQLGQDADAFLAGLKQLYGPQWRLRERHANRYLDILGRYGKFDDCKKLLEYMFEPGQRKPDTVSLNTVLSHCKTFRKIDLAVDFVRLFDTQSLRVADRVTIHLLLEMARKLRKPHLLGAVWRYAHFVKLTGSRTEYRGLELLRDGPDKERHILRLTDRVRSLWERPRDDKLTKGEFVAKLLLCDYLRSRGNHGTGVTEAGSQTNAATAVPLPPVVDMARQQSLFPFTQDRYYEFSKWVCQRAKRYEPAIPLGDFLHAALARDRSLHELAHTGTMSEPQKDGVLLDPVELPFRRVTRTRRGMDLSVLPGATSTKELRAQGREDGREDKTTPRPGVRSPSSRARRSGLRTRGNGSARSIRRKRAGRAEVRGSHKRDKRQEKRIEATNNRGKQRRNEVPGEQQPNMIQNPIRPQEMTAQVDPGPGAGGEEGDP